MGVAARPKSVDGGRDGGTERRTGLAAIEQYGRGEKDPETGVYDWYDLPDDHAAHSGQGRQEVRFLDLIEQWPLVVADFADVGVRLHRERDSLTWAEFHSLLSGFLLDPTSRLWRHFTRDTDEEGDDGV